LSKLAFFDLQIVEQPLKKSAIKGYQISPEEPALSLSNGDG